MKKSQIIELAKKKVGWRWDTRTAGLHVDLAWVNITGQLFAGDLSNLDLYAKPYTVDVVRVSPRPYSMLPVSILQTIDPANGVRHVYPLCEDGTFYVPIRGIDFNLLPDSDAAKTDNACGYYVKTDRVEYFQIGEDVTQLRMEIVPQFSDYDNDDDIPIPAGSAETFFALIVQSMEGKLETKDNIFKQ
jgi:hypothetical protein